MMSGSSAKMPAMVAVVEICRVLFRLSVFVVLDRDVGVAVLK